MPTRIMVLLMRCIPSLAVGHAYASLSSTALSQLEIDTGARNTLRYFQGGWPRAAHVVLMWPLRLILLSYFNYCKDLNCTSILFITNPKPESSSSYLCMHRDGYSRYYIADFIGTPLFSVCHLGEGKWNLLAK